MNSATINEQHQAIWTETTDAIYHMISSDVMLVFAAIVGLYLIILGVGFIQDFLGFCSFRKTERENQQADDAADEIYGEEAWTDGLSDDAHNYDSLSAREASAERRGDTFRVAVYKTKKRKVVNSASNRLRFLK